MRIFKTFLHGLFRVVMHGVAIFVVYAVLIQERTMTNIVTLETTTLPLWQTPLGWWMMAVLAVGIGGWKLSIYFRHREQAPKGLAAWDKYFTPKPVRRSVLARLRGMVPSRRRAVMA